MSLRVLSARVIRPYMPVAPTVWAAYRGYASKYRIKINCICEYHSYTSLLSQKIY